MYKRKWSSDETLVLWLVVVLLVCSAAVVLGIANYEAAADQCVRYQWLDTRNGC
jgi:hypothetical protein